MSTDELTHQLQELTLQEAQLSTQLIETKTAIERVRQRLIRNTHAATTTTRDQQRIRIGSRVEILNPTGISTVQTQQWIDNERTATITSITRNTRSPHDAVKYNLTTDNGTKTWRKAQNVRLLA